MRFVALLAVDQVVAVAAQQDVDAVAAEERVVACPPVDRDLDQGREVPRRGEAVLAAVRVDDQVLGGADVDRERRRVEAVEPDARAVGRGGELLGAVAAVDLDGVDAVAAFVQVGVVTGVPDHPVVAALAERLVVGVAAGQGVVLAAAEQKVDPPLPSSVSLPAWPKSWSPPEPPVRTSLPAPPNRFARGSAPLTSLRVITSLSPRPKTRISAVLATVGVPPTTATAPPLTRILPAALRLIAMLLASSHRTR